MPTTIDAFFAVVEICQNLSTMQNNMRTNVVQIQGSFHNGPGPLQGNLPATQQAIRELGNAFSQRLAFNQTIMTAYPAQLTTAAVALGISPTDVTNIQALLVLWSNNLKTAVFNVVADLDNGVTSLLAAVTVAMLPF
jgi:hypothetical protein